MSLRLAPLSPDCLEQVHGAFLEAFSDYQVDVGYMTVRVLGNRAIKNGISWEDSVGAYEGAGLVAFTLVGIGDREGERTAFDIATGIVPRWRGRGLAGRLFDFTLEGLRKGGASRFILEVIRSNEAAIRAYEKAGFRKERRFDCYLREAGPPSRAGCPPEDLEIRPADRELPKKLREEMDWLPSWENSLDAIRRVPDDLRVYGAWMEGSAAGQITWHPGTDWVMSLVVRRDLRRRGIATALLERVIRESAERARPLKAVNVLEEDRATGRTLERAGFSVYTRQYEMHRAI